LSILYFLTPFGALALKMGLVTRQMVREQLVRFIYSDVVEPHGSDWVWKSVGERLNQ